MPEPLYLFVNRLNTPLGEMLLVSDNEGNLRAIDWSDFEPRMMRLMRLHYGIHGYRLERSSRFTGLEHALDSYFNGNVAAIDSLPIKTAGTEFQRAVWNALRTVSCGTTISYAALAAKIGRPTAIRAVGAANGANPIGIVVPCHRVLGSNGTLTGYGGGMSRKAWLLQHEAANLVL